MSRATWLWSAATAAALVIGLAWGRYASPAKVRTLTVEHVVEKRIEVKVADTSVVEAVKWKTRIVTKPGGIRIVTLEAERNQVAATHDATTVAVATERLVYRDKLVESAKPQWSAGVFAGAGLDGGRHLGGEVSRRLFGPVWAGVKVDVPAKAAMAGVRIEF